MKIYPNEKVRIICINCKPSCAQQCIKCPLLDDCLFIHTGHEEFLTDEEDITVKENENGSKRIDGNN